MPPQVKSPKGKRSATMVSFEAVAVVDSVCLWLLAKNKGRDTLRRVRNSEASENGTRSSTSLPFHDNYSQDKWARRQRPFGLAKRARRVRLRGQQPKQSNATTRRLAVMNLALRGIEADFGPEHAATYRRPMTCATSYLGCSKTFALMGRAYAKAQLSMIKK